MPLCYETTLRSIYYATFQSNPSCCTVWGETIKYNHQISILQRKTMRITFFSDFNKHTISLFWKAKILKFIDFIIKWRTVFLLINLYQVLCTLYSPKCIYLWMIIIIITLDLHQMVFKKFLLIILQLTAQNHLQPPTITSWNFFQYHCTGINLNETPFNQIKYLIKNYFFNLHDNLVT